jgi:hypothetical protein
MSRRETKDAVEYGIRHGVFRALERDGVRGRPTLHYTLTGKPLPDVNRVTAGPCFDALLIAWGMTIVPVVLTTEVSSSRMNVD